MPPVKKSLTVRGDVTARHIRRTVEGDDKEAADDVLMTVWDDLEMHPATLLALRHTFHMSHATACQVESIPTYRLRGRSVIVEAHTGSGKTLAFLIPLVERLLNLNTEFEEANPGKPYRSTLLHAVVLSPFRALCRQTYLVLQQLLARMPYGIQCVLHAPTTPGKSRKLPVINQRGGGTILLTTPRDLLDMIEGGCIPSLGPNPFPIVIDEVDVTLEKYGGQVGEVLEKFAALGAATIDFGLFGATAMQSDAVRAFHESRKDTHSWSIMQLDDDGACTAQLSNRYVLFLGSDTANRVSHLVHLLNQHKTKRHIVFCNHADTADAILNYLKFFIEQRILKYNADGIQAVHGSMSETQRHARYKRFLNFGEGEGGAVLICTNIAAHGLDVRDVEYVVHFDAPDSMRTYCHRVGRTARMGMRGTNIVLLACQASTKEYEGLIGEMCKTLQISEWKILNVVALVMSEEVIASKKRSRD